MKNRYLFIFPRSPLRIQYGTAATITKARRRTATSTTTTTTLYLIITSLFIIIYMPLCCHCQRLRCFKTSICAMCIVHTIIRYQSDIIMSQCYDSTHIIIIFNSSPSSNWLLLSYNTTHSKKIIIGHNEVFSCMCQRLTCSHPCYC